MCDFVAITYVKYLQNVKLPIRSNKHRLYVVYG